MKLYHIAHKKDLPSIKRKGLIGVLDYILVDSGDIDKKGVNLVSDVDEYPFPLTNKNVILEINSNRLNKRKLIHVGDWWWRYQGNIPLIAIVSIDLP